MSEAIFGERFQRLSSKKVAVIGAGQVGASFGRLVIEAEPGDLVLIDIDGDLAEGKALDLFQAASISGKNVRVVGGSNYQLIENSDLVVITAGLARKPGMSREDLLKKNAEIVTGVAQKIKELAPEAIVIVVTNPLDVMTYLVWKVTGFSEKKVIGMAGILDGGRMKAFLAEELKAPPEEIETVVLGVHGDGMLAVPRLSTYRGRPITEILPREKIILIIKWTKEGGAEIVKLLKTGSAYFAPAQAIYEMAEAILNDRKKIMICSALLSGQYGISDCFLGVPVKLGASGIEEIINLELQPEEIKIFQETAASLKKNYQLLGL
jgi:malate dehydrogenase